MSRFSSPAMTWLRAIEARWPEASARLKKRAGPITLAVALELLLLWALLSLGVGAGSDDQPAGETIATFDVPSATPSQPAQEPRPVEDQPAASAPVQTAPSPDTPLPRALDVPPPVPLPRPQTAPPAAQPAPAPAPEASKAPGIRAVIRSDMAGNRGPADISVPGDSPRIAGNGPNGEPLYAAKWYREPTDEEFRGYFSRVGGSGWALINCRTEPEFRVDKCVLVAGSEPAMGSAVLAMAWQFRVRPPRVGGRSLVGEWVRIRIDYTIRRS